jgi:hypothetical protein
MIEPRCKEIADANKDDDCCRDDDAIKVRMTSFGHCDVIARSVHDRRPRCLSVSSTLGPCIVVIISLMPTCLCEISDASQSRSDGDVGSLRRCPSGPSNS